MTAFVPPPRADLDAALARWRREGSEPALAQLLGFVDGAMRAGSFPFAAAVIGAALQGTRPSAALWARRAALSRAAGDNADAERSAREALRLEPGAPIASALLAELLLDQHLCSETVTVCEACLARHPKAPHVLRPLAQARLGHGDAPGAVAAARSLVAVMPDLPAAIHLACTSALYDETLTPDALAALHRKFAPRVPAAPAAPFVPPASRAGRVRLGLLSADLRTHAMVYFIEPLLRGLDRERVDVFVYSTNAHRDAWTERLRGEPAQWRDLSALGDAAALSIMRADALDVLLDLAGHTNGGRPGLIAARAAPRQWSWFGYPYASMLPGIDATIGDATTLPPGVEARIGPVLRLPGAMLCHARDFEAPDVRVRAPGSAPMFASLNHLAKLSDATVALWSRVLSAVPASRLALSSYMFADMMTMARTSTRFARHGIDPARIDLRPPVTPLAQFLEHYADIDLALDPLPFNGGATTVQAAWMGVPTITLPGADLHNRLGATINRAAGLDEFIASDADDYVAKAVAWAGAHERRAELRAGMREQLARSALFDATRFAAGFLALVASP